MQNLKFIRLRVISDSNKSGNQFEFQKNRILIYASENNVGKSTLVKLPYWALGCSTTFDSSWKAMDVRVLLDFSINGDVYQVHRYKNIIHFREKNGKFKKYTKITGEFSKLFAELVNFKALLPDRNNEDELETPPPSFYFLPFYIDQKRSWTQAWNAFESLGQFKYWQQKIIKSHVGLFGPEYFEFEEKIYQNKSKASECTNSLNQLETSADVIETFVNKSSKINIDANEFKDLSVRITTELNELVELQEETLSQLTKYESDRAFLKHQKKLTEVMIEELKKDYDFSVEKVDGEQIQCPLCGVNHDNSVVNRASIMTDKQKAEDQLENISKSLKKTDGQIHKTQLLLREVEEKIRTIEEKFGIVPNSNGPLLSEIIESFAAASVQSKIQNAHTEKLKQKDAIKKKIDELKEDQAPKKDRREQINTMFSDLLSSYIRRLKAEGINQSEINSYLNYAKIVKEGGAAEGIRGVLAYYLVIYSLIREFGSECIAPLAIDTPNQHEQSPENYKRIANILLEEVPDDLQLIICAMEHPELLKFSENAQIIRLHGEKSLLKQALYSEVSPHFQNIV